MISAELQQEFIALYNSLASGESGLKDLPKERALKQQFIIAKRYEWATKKESNETLHQNFHRMCEIVKQFDKETWFSIYEYNVLENYNNTILTSFYYFCVQKLPEMVSFSLKNQDVKTANELSSILAPLDALRASESAESSSNFDLTSTNTQTDASVRATPSGTSPLLQFSNSDRKKQNQEIKQTSESIQTGGKLCSSPLTNKTVIVVGAGIAGVAAAQTLVSKGCKVILLEARDSVGGRARNLTTKSGFPVPMGPMYLHDRGPGYGPLCSGSDNPLEGLLLKYDINHETINEYDFRETRLIGNPASNKEVDMKTLKEIFSGESNTTSDGSSTKSEKLVQKIQEFLPLTDAGISEALYWNRLVAITNLSYSKQFSGYRSDKTRDHFVSGQGGYQKLINALHGDAASVEAIDPDTQKTVKLLKTHFNSSVKSIDCSQLPVKVTLQSGVTFSGNAVVCTLPLGVLRKGNISIPNLPKEMEVALNHILVAQQMKVVIEFERPFWNKDADYINIIDSDIILPNANTTPPNNPLLSFLNLYKFSSGKAICLIASFYGDSVEGLKNKTEKEVSEFVLSYLKTAFGTDYQEPVSCNVVGWYEDPYAYGSWASIGPDSTPEDLEQLMSPIFDGKLMLAGDHIGPFGLLGTVHSAYESGKRAANKLVTCLEPSPQKGRQTTP